MWEDFLHFRINIRFLKDYSSGRFQILYGDSTDIEYVQRCSFDGKN